MLGNKWQVQENNGPTVSLHDGLVTIEGTFKSQGKARLWQGIASADFVSLEARITVHSKDHEGKTTNSRVGLFVARETQRGNEVRVDGEVTVSRHLDPTRNTIQTRIIKQGEEEKEFTDVKGFEWKLDVPVLVRIERLGRDKETPTVRIMFDGIPVLDGAPIPSLGRTTNELRVGIFTEGQIGRVVKVDIDDVEIVERGGARK